MEPADKIPAAKRARAPRRSACAAKSRAEEIERLHRMSVKERISAALGMSDRYSWLKPAPPAKPE